MLNSIEMDVLLRASAALRQAGQAALADEVAGLLASASAARAAMAKARQAGAAGRPRALFTVELEPGWQATAQGAKAAADMVAETLKQHGQRNPPSQGSLAVSLSRSGTWQRVFTTLDGTFALTVRRQGEQKRASSVRSV